jgi:hypothetical protein
MYYPHILGMLLSNVGLILHYIMRVDWFFVGGGTSSPSRVPLCAAMQSDDKTTTKRQRFFEMCR